MLKATSSSVVRMSLMQPVKLCHMRRSPHGRQPVPGPFLSPNAASFYPRQPLGSARARDQALPEQARDARQPDWNTQVGMVKQQCAIFSFIQSICKVMGESVTL